MINTKLCTAFVSVLLCAGCKTASPPEGKLNPVKSSAAANQWPDELLPLNAAPKQHKVLFENEKVRVFEVYNPPGGVAPLHVHAVPSVLIVDEPSTIRRRNSAGEIVQERTLEKGAAWAPASSEPYSIENIGDNPIRLYRIEMKP